MTQLSGLFDEGVEIFDAALAPTDAKENLLGDVLFAHPAIELIEVNVSKASPPMGT